MNRSRSLILTALLLGSLTTLAAPAPKEKFHLYVLAGQSNMAGRGPVEEEDRTPPWVGELELRDAVQEVPDQGPFPDAGGTRDHEDRQPA